MDNTLDILSIPVANKSRAEVCAQVFSYIENHVPAMIATANAEMIMKAQTDRELATILRAAELVVPDGAGVLWAAEQQGKKFKERVTGVDLACSLLQEAAARQTPVYFLGGMPGIAARAAADIEKKVGKLQLVGTHSGFFFRVGRNGDYGGNTSRRDPLVIGGVRRAETGEVDCAACGTIGVLCMYGSGRDV